MMARGMGLKTIAEGVEEPNQLEILKVLECDEIQGYIFGRPVPPEIFELEHIDKTTHSLN
jgi:FOG: EAL domain